MGRDAVAQDHTGPARAGLTPHRDGLIATRHVRCGVVSHRQHDLALGAAGLDVGDAVIHRCERNDPVQDVPTPMGVLRLVDEIDQVLELGIENALPGE